MPVRLLLTAFVGKFSDFQQLQQTTYSTKQKEWLVEKFELYKEHHDRKTLKLFFPSLYEEYFAIWPPIPTAEDVKDAKGDTTVATSRIRGGEQKVRDCRPLK